MILAYVGDALWVLALAIMFGASRQAWARIPQGVRVPLMGAHLPAMLVVWAVPVGAFLFSIWLALQSRSGDMAADTAFIVFGVRALSASLLALIHLRWLGAGMKALDREGRLKDPPLRR